MFYRSVEEIVIIKVSAIFVNSILVADFACYFMFHENDNEHQVFLRKGEALYVQNELGFPGK